MGWVTHHAIVVTSWDEGVIRQAHMHAASFGLAVSDIVADTINGYHSVFVAPDGSKEGWAESDIGDKARDKFVHWLNAQRHGDGSSLEWCEIRYGSDDRSASVVRSAWHCHTSPSLAQ